MSLFIDSIHSHTVRNINIIGNTVLNKYSIKQITIREKFNIIAFSRINFLTMFSKTLSFSLVIFKIKSNRWVRINKSNIFSYIFIQ
ncbi:MAG: hypothetical protein DBX97_23245 [Collinsella tanakaei]|nr:MAG: hypothetical protein DBX97_23245 [Collinsella tanakaei]